MLPKKQKVPQQRRMKPETLKMMKDRKKHKSTETYKAIDSKIKKECRKAEEWLNDKCFNIKLLSRTHRSIQMYQEIKKLISWYIWTSGGCIKDKNGQMLFKADNIVEREYAEEFFDRRHNPTRIQDNNVAVPGFSIVRAVRELTSSSKKKEGGIALYLSERWCNPQRVCEGMSL